MPKPPAKLNQGKQQSIQVWTWKIKKPCFFKPRSYWRLNFISQPQPQKLKLVGIDFFGAQEPRKKVISHTAKSTRNLALEKLAKKAEERASTSNQMKGNFPLTVKIFEFVSKGLVLNYFSRWETIMLRLVLHVHKFEQVFSVCVEHLLWN